MADSILLKWGTIKSWDFESKQSQELIQKYLDLGASVSCMAQRDTDEQKQILYDLINQHEGTIHNDWDGDEYTKEQAIEYLKNYGKR